MLLHLQESSRKSNSVNACGIHSAPCQSFGPALPPDPDLFSFSSMNSNSFRDHVIRGMRIVPRMLQFVPFCKTLDTIYRLSMMHQTIASLMFSPCLSSLCRSLTVLTILYVSPSQTARRRGASCKTSPRWNRV